MPSLLRKVCGAPGCFDVVEDGSAYCDECMAARRRRDDANRSPERQRRYNNPRWKRLRRKHLANNPLCVRCKKQGRTTAATTVDHEVPVEHGGAMWDEDNLQSLCSTCHSGWKQRQEARAYRDTIVGERGMLEGELAAHESIDQCTSLIS